METGVNKETLAAFVDGELLPKEMERVAALLAASPELAAQVRRQESLRESVRDAFADILDQPVPQRLMQAARTAPVSYRWRLRHALRAPSWRRLMPAAAALAVGIVIGIVLQPTADLATNPSGRLVAQRSLRAALDRQLASATYAGGAPHIGISFRNKSGEDCRTFVDGAAAGLACHRDNAWVIGTVVDQAPESANSPYRMAGSEMPTAVRDAVAASIVGAPFDAQSERAARDSGWK